MHIQLCYRKDQTNFQTICIDQFIKNEELMQNDYNSFLIVLELRSHLHTSHENHCSHLQKHLSLSFLVEHRHPFTSYVLDIWFVQCFPSPCSPLGPHRCEQQFLADLLMVGESHVLLLKIYKVLHMYLFAL